MLGAVSLGGDLIYPGGLYKPNVIFHSLPATIQLVSLLHGLPVESKGNTSQVVPYNPEAQSILSLNKLAVHSDHVLEGPLLLFHVVYLVVGLI